MVSSGYAFPLRFRPVWSTAGLVLACGFSHTHFSLSHGQLADDDGHWKGPRAGAGRCCIHHHQKCSEAESDSLTVFESGRDITQGQEGRGLPFAWLGLAV